MFKVRVMNKIAPAGLRKLDPSNYQIGQDLERYQGMLIRSADLHSHQFPKELLAIPGRARAPTTSPSTSAMSGASPCSTPPAPTPTG